jgi:NADPH2 dehydrogenase
MASLPQLIKLSTLKTAEAFRAHLQRLQLDIPCDDTIITGSDSPLTQPVQTIRINGKRIGNRYAVQPMEGWDGTETGGVSEHVERRWRRFGQSGAKLICGGEAMAVRPDGRANPNQLVVNEANQKDLAKLVSILLQAHRERFGISEDPVIGFQLTHSGRFCKPTDKRRLEPRVAYRHPLLDPRFGVTSDAQVFTDDEVEKLIKDYIQAARIAWNVGADFVDIKHCHGYLLHEFLSAFRRPGRFGGSFENRTRILREIVAGIRADNNPIDLSVRLSAFDTVPFKPDPATSQPGKPGQGIPEDFSKVLPYEYGFGVDRHDPLLMDLSEPLQFLELCAQFGIKLVNLSAGSPYYNPHVQRPAAYPPSDGYLPPEDPLVGVARQMKAVRELKARINGRVLLVGSAYSYLQEFLPQVAQAAVRNGWVDVVGIGRAVLSYPDIFADALAHGELKSKFICRTFSDCTTGPRNGLISGCYPLDDYYASSAAGRELKEIKRNFKAPGSSA